MQMAIQNANGNVFENGSGQLSDFSRYLATFITHLRCDIVLAFGDSFDNMNFRCDFRHDA